MQRNSIILTLVLVGLAGLLVMCSITAAALVAFLRVSSVSGSAIEVVEATVEVGVPLEEPLPASEEESPVGDEAAPPDGSGVIAPSGFNAYMDDGLHFSLAYPDGWELDEVFNAYGRVFLEKDPEPGGLGPQPKLYVTFVPLDDVLAEGAYGFMPHEAVRSFSALPVGSAQPVVPDAFPAGAFTYTRLPDREVGGWQAVVIENEEVWEAYEETTDRRVLVVTEEGTFILGSIYATPEELALFEQVLDSFQLAP